MACVFDIETNGLLIEKDGTPPMDRIHCIKVYNTTTGKMITFDPENKSIDDGVKYLQKADQIIGHNIVGFDIPAIQKLFPKFKPKGEVIDTYVWAACTWPDIKSTDFDLYRKGILPVSLIGSHSLEAYGYRLGILKGSFAKQTDWQKWTPKMSEYCEQDVNVTLKLIDKLRSMKTSWEQVTLEQGVLNVLNRQQQHGVLFDVESAHTLYSELSDKREKLRMEMQKEFPPFFKRKGKLFTPKRDNRKMGYTKGATMMKIELVEFNPSSSVHIARMLMQKYDWKPTEFADKDMAPVELKVHYNRLGISEMTIPKVDDEILGRLQYPEAEKLAEFQMLQKRCAMLAEGKQAWLRHYNDTTNRIHGAINQFGAVTGRCIHFNPNLGQVTSARSPYGKECRSLFKVPDGWYLVGCDADGLEARCKAHYITPYDDGELIKTILEGNKADGTDIHSLNRDRLGLASRDVAKTWYYAFMYGAGNLKLGRIALEDENYKDFTGDPAKLGSKLRAKMSKNFKGLKQLIDGVQSSVKIRKSKYGKMWVTGLDNRKIPVRAIYSALNTLLQGAGAVIMKKALVIADDLIQAEGLTPVKDYVQVLFVHDELQFECRTKEIAEIVAKCAEDSIRLTGEHFKFRCPLSGSADIGKTWLDTH